MKSFLTSGRRTAQWVWHSRAGYIQPWIIANSVPKSGTHLAKAILKGAGYRFAGHVGENEIRLLTQPATASRSFATAHVTRPMMGPGIRLLVFRDPVDVAFSMAVYIRARSDHPRNAVLSGMSLSEAIDLTFQGIGDLEPLSERFQKMYNWAVLSDAKAINFATFKQNPQKLLHMVSAHSPDPDLIQREISRWNPTKRTALVEDEMEIKHRLRQSNRHHMKAVYDVYEKIQSLT